MTEKPKPPNSSIRSRRVSAELRQLRTDQNMTEAQVAKALGMSASKVSRIETGERGLTIIDVANMLGLYQVPQHRRDQLLDLVRKADERGLWFAQGSGLPELWQTLIDFERRANRIQNYEALVVPGLLQTADYCGAMIQGVSRAITEGELDKLVGARMARQAILRRRDVEYLAVVSEAALQQVIGDSSTQRRQLRRLVDEADRPNVTIRVIPRASGAHAGLEGPFQTLDFPDEPSVIYVENQTTCLFMEEKDDLEAYRLRLSNILGVALSPAKSVDLISALAEQL
ncbi:MAG TPA: helix-turn-helix transcriptional regulator [Pseudonocardiaceae bacterium]|nr:helix-turn-helix transcriptional regulator [Pseudonocardiaceae bacterium]